MCILYYYLLHCTGLLSTSPHTLYILIAFFYCQSSKVKAGRTVCACVLLACTVCWKMEMRYEREGGGGELHV